MNHFAHSVFAPFFSSFFSHFIKLFLFFPFLLLTNLLCHPRQISVAEYVSLCFFSPFDCGAAVHHKRLHKCSSASWCGSRDQKCQSTHIVRSYHGWINHPALSFQNTHLVLSHQECSIYWEPHHPNNYQSQHWHWYWSILSYWDCYFRLVSRFYNYITGLVIKLEWCSRVFVFT